MRHSYPYTDELESDPESEPCATGCRKWRTSHSDPVSNWQNVNFHFARASMNNNKWMLFAEAPNGICQPTVNAKTVTGSLLVFYVVNKY